jgi:hypothetical protein
LPEYFPGVAKSLRTLARRKLFYLKNFIFDFEANHAVIGALGFCLGCEFYLDPTSESVFDWIFQQVQMLDCPEDLTNFLNHFSGMRLWKIFDLKTHLSI